MNWFITFDVETLSRNTYDRIPILEIRIEPGAEITSTLPSLIIFKSALLL